jgi:diguanylate cyclase (GGDEF)-like protein
VADGGLALLLPPTPGESQWLVKLSLPARAYQQPRNFSFATATVPAFLQEETRINHGHGLYGGIMLATVLYNLFLFFSLRQRLYLLYVLYASCFGAIWLLRAGMGLVFLWPHWPQWDAQATFFFIGLSMITGNAFTREFLGLDMHVPLASKLLRLLSFCVLVLLLGGALQLYAWVETPMAFLALTICALYLWAAFRRLQEGSRLARYFLLATGMLLLGTLLYTLAFLGVLPITPVTAHAAQVGSGLEMLLFAFALGYRIRELEREKRLNEERYVARLQAEIGQRTQSLQQALAQAQQAQEAAEQARHELEAANQRLAHLSATDSLTGLANRRSLDQTLEQEWRRAFRLGTSLALVLVDLDHFKAYNDALGHQAGDELLQAFAQELASFCRRTSDLAARYGGEEFVLVLPGLDPQSAKELAERLRQKIETCQWPHPSSPVASYVTISCGVAVVKPVEGVPVAQLVQQADEALYVAKGAGRNRVHLRPVSGSFPRVVAS